MGLPRTAGLSLYQGGAARCLAHRTLCMSPAQATSSPYPMGTHGVPPRRSYLTSSTLPLQKEVEVPPVPQDGSTGSSQGGRGTGWLPGPGGETSDASVPLPATYLKLLPSLARGVRGFTSGCPEACPVRGSTIMHQGLEPGKCPGQHAYDPKRYPLYRRSNLAARLPITQP